MTLPLRNKTDVVPFVKDLIGRSELEEVVAAFADDRMPGHLDHLRSCALEDLESDQTARILAHWESSVAPDASWSGADGLRDRLEWIRSLAAARWDFRLGAERDAIPTSCELLDDTTSDAVYRLARAWGMLDPAPAKGDFDHVIVLGGLIRANVNRPKAAAELLASGSVRTLSVVGLSAYRRMSIGERQLAKSIGCDARTESEALAFGVQQAFGIDSDTWQATERPFVTQSELEFRARVTLATAPLNDDGTRANTGGAFGWFISDDSHQVHSGTALLSVTTPIYWISSHVSLLTRVPEGVTLTTTGADPARAAPALRQTFRSQHYLQEIKSALDSMESLLSWASSSVRADPTD